MPIDLSQFTNRFTPRMQTMDNAMPTNTAPAGGGLTPEQISGARSWINQQYANSAPAGGFQFNGDFSIGGPGLSSPTDQRYLLGAAQAMGYDANDLSQILGSYDPNTIRTHIDSAFGDGGSINRAANTFAMDQGWTTPDELKQFMFANDVGNRNHDDYTGAAVNWAGGAGGGFALDQDYATQWQAPQGAGGGGRATGGSMGGQASGNPYLQFMSDNISQNFTNTLQNQWLPSIRSNSIAAGGLGGARQGIAEAGAIGQAGQGLSSALGQLWGGAYESGANRDLQRYSIDTSADLANQSFWGNYDLGSRGLDLQGIGLGAQIMNMGSQGPWSGVNNMGNLLNGVGNQNNTTTNGSQSGGGWGGLLGGALAGGTAARNWGWW